MSTLSFIAGALFLPSLALAALLVRVLIGAGSWLGGVTLTKVPDRLLNRAIHAGLVACAERAWAVQAGPLVLSLVIDRRSKARRSKVASAIADALAAEAVKGAGQ